MDTGGSSNAQAHLPGFLPPVAGTHLSTRNRKEAFSEQGARGESEMDIRKMLIDWEAKLGPDHPSIAAVVSSLAAILEQQERWEEAELLHQRTVRLQEKSCGQWHENVAEAREHLAKCALMNSKYSEAQSLLEVAMKIRRSSGKKKPMAHCMELMGDVRIATNDQGGAVHLLERAVVLLENNDGFDPDVASLLVKLAGLQSRMGPLPDAEKSLARAVSILRGHPTRSPALAEALTLQAALATRLKKYEAAETMLRECLLVNEVCRTPSVPLALAIIFVRHNTSPSHLTACAGCVLPLANRQTTGIVRVPRTDVCAI